MLRNKKRYVPYGNGGFLEVGGGALSGASTGAAIGSAVPGVGTAIGAGVGAIAGGLGAFFGRKKRQKQEARQERNYLRELEEQRLAGTIENTRGILSTYNTQGNNINSYAKGGEMYAGGGKVPYSNQVDLGDGVTLFKGPKHENGGIPLDTNNDMVADAEVEGDEVKEGDRIFSNRLNPDEETINQIKSSTGLKVSGSHANIAEKIAREKGNIINTGSPISNNKEEIMNSRYEEALDILFNNQEEMKSKNNIDKLAKGGKMKRYNLGGIFTDPSNSDPKKEGFSYKVKNPNGSTTLVEIPPEGYQVTDESITPDETIIPMTQSDTLFTPSKGLRKLPGFRGVKSAPRFNPNTRQVSDRKFYAYGGKLPKYQYGTNDLSGYGTDYVTSNNMVGVPQPNLNYQFQAAGSTPAKAGGLQGGFDLSNINTGAVTNVASQLGNYMSYLGNKKAISKMKTNQTPYLAPAPRFTYNDQSYAAREGIRDFRSRGIDTIKRSTSQDPSTAIAKVTTDSIKAQNQVNMQEGQIRQEAENRYNFLLNRNNLVNAGAINQTRSGNLERYNQRIGLGVDARNAFTQGILGNIQASQARKGDDMRALLAYLSQGDTGVADRLPERVRRYYNIDN